MYEPSLLDRILAGKNNVFKFKNDTQSRRRI
nr:MAG TPA: hypothetical protein [Caudoviricetes sp.]